MILTKYKHPKAFYLLSTIIPWTFWFIAAYISNNFEYNENNVALSSIIGFLGLLAPFVISLFLILPNKELKSDMLNRIFNFKEIKISYVFISFFLMLISILLAQLISLLFGYSAAQFYLRGSYTFSSGVFPIWFMLIIAPVLEELAWHTYGTDSLRTRFTLFTTSIIFALFWAIWHLPLSFIKDYYHSNVLEAGWIYSLNFVVSLFPFVIIMNWLYYKTNRNIIVPIVFHITAGFFNEIFATHPMSKVIQTGLLLILSVYIVVKEKDLFFNKKIIQIKPNKPFHFPSSLKYLPIVVLAFFTFSSKTTAQPITQIVRGSVYDAVTKESLPFANISISNTDPMIGAASDLDGNFVIKNVPIGRRNILIGMVGYESYLIKELLVSTGKEVVLNIALQQTQIELGEVVVRVSKDVPLNSMSTLSSRQFTVEETQLYAGGMDDPARLVSAFAGVATPSVSSNGISVRGNNPDGLLWQIEGVEVPTPNHFANLTIAGGGLLTALSSQMMGNSDFFTGAFPAEYGNASSGVFDIKLNTGNSSKRQYSIQAGLIGLDFSTQGPFVKGSDASYIMNYRYSTMALISPILPDDAGILKYQDLSFKLNLPTKKIGTFSLWGIGALDGQNMKAIDSVDWKSDFDRDNSQTSLYMFASGLSHKMSINSNTFLNTTLSVSGDGLTHKEQRYDYSLQLHPQSKAENNTWRYTIQSNLSKYFGKNHFNKTGFSYQYLGYNIDVEQSASEGTAPIPISNRLGNSGLLQVYSQSKINFGAQISLNVGLNSQYFFLNKDFSIEPRVGIKYNLNDKHSFALAFGLHSRIEQLSTYFIEKAGTYPNKKLKLMKSAHYVFSYNVKLSDNLRLSIEPYYQKLFNIPVSPNSYISTINNNNTLFFNEILNNDGTGRNIGIDFTFEQFLHNGLYYLFTASLFDSKYTAADGIERNTRFNKNYVLNIVAGKEWIVGKNNNKIISVNARLNYLGGSRIEPIDEVLSIQQKKIIYAETNGNLAYGKKFANLPILSFTISYRINNPSFSSVISLQILNAAQTQEFSSNYYNIKTGAINSKYDGLLIPNLSYRIEF